jgi:hypothetical protein
MFDFSHNIDKNYAPLFTRFLLFFIPNKTFKSRSYVVKYKILFGQRYITDFKITKETIEGIIEKAR